MAFSPRQEGHLTVASSSSCGASSRTAKRGLFRLRGVVVARKNVGASSPVQRHFWHTQKVPSHAARPATQSSPSGERGRTRTPNADPAAPSDFGGSRTPPRNRLASTLALRSAGTGNLTRLGVRDRCSLNYL